MKIVAIMILITALTVGFASHGEEVSVALEVSLVSDLPSPQVVGTTITWTADASEVDPVTYRLSVGQGLDPLRVMYDFGTRDVFPWTPIEDGTYSIVLSAREPSSGEITNVETTFVIESRVDDSPIVTGTDHPLVALYSAPPCESGQIRVQFRRIFGQIVYSTPPKPCNSDDSMNFYLAGMRADTYYFVRHEIADDNGVFVLNGPLMVHRTGTPSLNFPNFRLAELPDENTNLDQSIVLHSWLLGGSALPFPVATDLSGQVVWYYEAPTGNNIGLYVTRPLPGGNILVIPPDGRLYNQILWEIDLAGNIVMETTVPRINEQLVAMGYDPIGAIHHEAVRFPNGHTLVIATVSRVIEDVQGPGPVNILGSMVVDLDENWQVTWAWNAFDHLDVTREASLGETCAVTCDDPAFFGDENTKDWNHSNSLSYSPADGNLIISIRNQDWVVKIDYQDGTGTGDIIWRLGLDGDFTIESDDPNPWFTHQHDARYISDDQIVLYDNGTLRCETSPNPLQDCYSRGQVFRIDEEARVATLEMNTHLGVYAPALGSAQLLSNGNFHFASGTRSFRTLSNSDEYLPDGTRVYSLLAQFSTYRSFRMRDLYTP